LIGLDEYTEFLTYPPFSNIMFSSTSGVAKHDLRCMQFVPHATARGQKGDRLPFATAPKII